MNILVGSVISRYPCVPGSVLNRLNFIVGLQRLGHEVYFAEEIGADACVNAKGEPCAYEKSANRDLFLELMTQFGLGGHACQVFAGGEQTAGLSLAQLLSDTKDALLINMSGHVTLEPILENASRRVYVDQDPVYTQLWRSEYGVDLNFGAHEVFFSVGLNIGTEHSPIPGAGVAWQPLLPVIVPELWSDADKTSGETGRFTTVASWSGYGDLEYGGAWYGAKHQTFTAFADLPKLSGQPFEVALKSYRDEDEGIQALRRGGWCISSAGELASLERYKNFIAASKAEIGIAKTAYVKGNSGWFSDRAAHYLASGRPVLAQSTGFERVLPTGEGVVTFETTRDAAAGANLISAEYDKHAGAARAFARDYLDYRKVLPEMLERCLA